MKRLTQVEVADRAEISVRNYQRIEAGDIVPKLSTLFRILKCMDVPLGDFFRGIEADEYQSISYPMKQEGIYSYEISEIEKIYQTIKQENDFLANMTTKTFYEYAKKPILESEGHVALTVATIDGVFSNDLCNQNFNMSKSYYRYEEYTDVAAMHGVWNALLEHGRDQLHCIDVKVDYGNGACYGRNIGRLVNHSLDNPIFLSACIRIDEEVEVRQILDGLMRVEPARLLGQEERHG